MLFLREFDGHSLEDQILEESVGFRAIREGFVDNLLRGKGSEPNNRRFTELLDSYAHLVFPFVPRFRRFDRDKRTISLGVTFVNTLGKQ